MRDTIEHEILEGEAAAAFLDGDQFASRVNCLADAGVLESIVRFTVCASCEVAIDSGIQFAKRFEHASHCLWR